MASEVMRTVHEREPFPTRAVDFVKPGRRGATCCPLHGCYGLIGDQPALRSSRAPSRPRRVICVCCVKIVFQTVDSENIATS